MKKLDKKITQSFDFIRTIEKSEDKKCFDKYLNDIEKYVECKLIAEKLIKNIKKKNEARIVFLENEYLDCTKNQDQEACKKSFLNKFKLELKQLENYTLN